jgi:hypothetical protein
MMNGCKNALYVLFLFYLSTNLNGFLNYQQPYPAAAPGKPSEVYSLSNKQSLAFAPFIHDLSTPLLLLLLLLL